jgi:hypothetical protein
MAESTESTKDLDARTPKDLDRATHSVCMSERYITCEALSWSVTGI